jgi:hypothetical protein
MANDWMNIKKPKGMLLAVIGAGVGLALLLFIAGLTAKVFGFIGLEVPFL